jgi:hypothetical protein
MANILTVPASGAIIFDNQTAGSSTISPLSSAPRLQYDNSGGLNITSYTTGASAIDRFSVDGANGRLFSVSDSLTGVIFSVNDAAGLPIIEVNSTTTDVVNIGTYGTNALVVSGSNVGIGTTTPTAKLDILDTTLAGSGSLSGSALNIAQTWNTTGTPTAIKLNVTDTASNAASLLMDLRVGGVSRFSVDKDGSARILGTIPRLRFGADPNPFFYAEGNVLNFRGSQLVLQGNNATPPGSLSFFRYDSSPALFGEASGTIAQRNGINPQESRIYGTYTDTSNYRRLALKMSTAGVAQIVAEGNGTGAADNRLEFVTGGATRMTVAADGGITASGTVTFGAGGAILNSPAAGIFTITNAAGTGFGRLCFGPATSSFAAFRSTGTTIDVVTGNESAFANMAMNNLTISGQLVVSNSPLTSNTNVAGTTGVQNAFTLSTTTNGVAAATFGPRLRFQAESASGTTRDAAAIDAVWTDATDATRTADIVFNTVSSAGALTERMRLSSQGNLTASGDIEATDSTKGVILKSPDGTRWRIIIDDSGELTATAL